MWSVRQRTLNKDCPCNRGSKPPPPTLQNRQQVSACCRMPCWSGTQCTSTASSLSSVPPETSFLTRIWPASRYSSEHTSHTQRQLFSVATQQGDARTGPRLIRSMPGVNTCNSLPYIFARSGILPLHKQFRNACGIRWNSTNPHRYPVRTHHAQTRGSHSGNKATVFG